MRLIAQPEPNRNPFYRDTRGTYREWETPFRWMQRRVHTEVQSAAARTVSASWRTGMIFSWRHAPRSQKKSTTFFYSIFSFWKPKSSRIFIVNYRRVCKGWSQSGLFHYLAVNFWTFSCRFRQLCRKLKNVEPYQMIRYDVHWELLL